MEEKKDDYKERFRIIFMESSIAITLYNSDGKLIDANKACLKLINVSNVDDIKGFDLFDDPNLPKDAKEKLLKGEIVKFEIVYDFDKVKETLKTDKSGILYLNAIITPIVLKPKGSVSYYLNQVQDITERRRSEQKLRESEEKYRNLFENSLEGIAILKGQEPIAVNQAFLELFGYDNLEDFNTKSLIEHTAPESRETVLNRFKMRDLGNIAEEIYEIKIIQKNGKLRDIELSTKGITIGNKLYRQTIFRDITERKKSEEALKESELMLQKSQEIGKIGSFEMELATGDVRWSDQLYKLFGLKREGKTIDYEKVLALIHPEDRERAIKVSSEATKELRPYTLEHRVVHPDGEILELLVTGDIIRNEQNEPIKIGGTIQDITNTKKIENEREEALKQAEFYKDLFAHDMNNILQSIISAGEYYSMFQNDPEKLKVIGDIAEVVKTHAERGATLVSNVRKLSRLAKSETELRPVEIFNILHNSIENIISSFQEKDVKIDVIGLTKDMKILGNELLIDIFDNLLHNAVKFNDDENEVEIEVKLSKIQENDSLFIKFEFLDHGIGVPDKNKEYLFERSYNKDISKRSMGLGLSLVKKIVEKFDGKIWVEDRVKGDFSKGGNFIVMLREDK